MTRLVTLLGLLFASAPLFAQELNIYSWSEYLPEKVLTLFTRTTGIKVNAVTYDSNEEMYEQVNENKGAFDLVIPSTYYVSKMRAEGLLRQLDKSFFTNLGNLDERLLNQKHDPGNEYSLPYLWGTTGLFFDGGKLGTEVTAWADLWRPEFRGKVMLTDDMREVFHIALRVLGHSGNSTDPKAIEAAYRKLVELKPNIREYNSDSPKDAVLEGGAEVGMIWNGEAYLAHRSRFTVQYVYPKEGAILWMDNLAIPRHARNVTAAHQFIDFLMKPGIAALTSESIGYATPNKAAHKEIDSWFRGSAIVYPGAEVLQAAELQVDVGDSLALYEQYWRRLRQP